jgi:hypothetical protein
MRKQLEQRLKGIKAEYAARKNIQVELENKQYALRDFA